MTFLVWLSAPAQSGLRSRWQPEGASAAGVRRGRGRVASRRRTGGRLVPRVATPPAPAGRGGLPGALHGTLVLPKPGGGTVTVLIQNGRVTAVSQSSVTLKSDDGFTRTYAVTGSTIVAARRDGIGSVKTGDRAWATATASGGTMTALRVGDLSQLRFGPGPAGQRLVPPSRSGSADSFPGGFAGD